MNRIESIFAQHRRLGEKALMPFLTAGDPDLATTSQLLATVQAAGASICELGIPFSDPLADGPVIQDSMAHALSHGVRLNQVFDLVAEHRSGLDIGLVAMASYSIACRMGVANFVRRASEVGIDGLIFPDLPLEESDEVRLLAADHGLVCSLLIAPTTPIARAKAIARASSGFVYLLARGGLTGEQSQLPCDLPQRIAAVRAVTELPIAVGFGISNPQQVQDVLTVADAAIVGSAIMRCVAQYRLQGSEVVVDQVGQFVRALIPNREPKGGLLNATGGPKKVQ